MPHPRFQRLDPAVRETLLEVAGSEFARAGYEGASLNRIIAAAGLSKGVFYYYFDDKADLAATVLELALEAAIGSLERFQPPGEGVDFWPYLEALARGSVVDLQRGAERAELVSRLGTAVSRDPALAARVAPFLARAMRVSARMWRRGQQVGAVRDDLPPEVLAELVARVKEVLTRALLPADRAPREAEMQRFIAVHLDLARRIAAPRRKR